MSFNLSFKDKCFFEDIWVSNNFFGLFFYLSKILKTFYILTLGNGKSFYWVSLRLFRISLSKLVIFYLSNWLSNKREFQENRIKNRIKQTVFILNYRNQIVMS